MASGYQEQRRLQQQKPDFDVQEDAKDQQTLETMEEGMEMAPDQAGRVGSQFGNAALAALLGNQIETPGAGGVEAEEEEAVELVEEVGEDVDADRDLDAPSHGGGGVPTAPADNGGGGADGDPWAVGHLFGGDDDDDDPNAPTRSGRIAPSPRRSFQAPADDPFAETIEDDGELTMADIDGIDRQIGPTPPLDDAPRDGDAIYQTVEACLFDPQAIGRRVMVPEDLVGRDGATDPIGRPRAMARFLAESGRSRRARQVSRTLAGATSVLFPEVGGFAGGVARMANLAVCAEALEGGGERTDRAVALALAEEAWPATVSAARPLAQEGRLHAPDVLEALLGGPVPSVPVEELPPPSVLGGRALAGLLPPAYIPEVPPIDLDSDLESGVGSDDPDLAELDAALAFFATGYEVATESPDRPIPASVTEPALHAARYLMNAAGKAHVEVAAAGFAVSRVRPGAPVRGPLDVVDNALGRVARTILRAGRRVEGLAGLPRNEVDPRAVEAVVEELESARLRLLDLRRWAFETLAGALDV